MFLKRSYGIDLGSSSVKIYSNSKNKSYIQKNMIASSGRKIIAVGNEAYEMFEKEPSHISVSSPMAFGMIANVELQEIVLYVMIKKIVKFFGAGSTIYFSVPLDMTAVEKRAYYAVANGHWMRKNRVFMVEAPIVDAIAMGLDPERNEGSMIVNIGAQTTQFSVISDGRIIISRQIPIGGRQMNEAVCSEIRKRYHLQIGTIGAQTTQFSVISDGRIIISRQIPIGGRQMNEAVCSEIRKRYHLQIGTRTAKRLKLFMGRLTNQKKDARKVVGIDSVSGLPREEVVSSYVVNAGIMNCVNEIAAEMKTFLERIPPQISYRIATEGIYLTGGSTRLPNLDNYLASYTGYTFNLSDLYEMSAVTGLEKIIRDKSLQKWAQPVTQRKL